MISSQQTVNSLSDATSALRQKHWEALIERYTKQTKTSKQMTQTYRSVLADPRVSEWFDPPTKEMCYLIVGKEARGARIWDIDGNEYVDIIMGFGSNLLGHNPPFIKEALQEQLEKGILLRGEGGGFLSTAHTDEDIDLIIQGMTDSITELQGAGFF